VKRVATSVGIEKKELLSGTVENAAVSLAPQRGYVSVRRRVKTVQGASKKGEPEGSPVIRLNSRSEPQLESNPVNGWICRLPPSM